MELGLGFVALLALGLYNWDFGPDPVKPKPVKPPVVVIDEDDGDVDVTPAPVPAKRRSGNKKKAVDDWGKGLVIKSGQKADDLAKIEAEAAAEARAAYDNAAAEPTTIP